MQVVLLLAVITAVCARGLIDHSIATGTTPQYLDGQWKATSSAGHDIIGYVPGDIITDLQRNNIIGDPIYNTNWLDNSSLWANNDWTYTTVFDFNAGSVQDVWLVFDGVKMGANILLNNQTLGQVTDQFLRYNFSIKQVLKPSGNQLQVIFPKNYGIDTAGRFMACTGGWDWAPYSNTQQGDTQTLSYGIWKSVYVVSVPNVAVTQVVPAIKYLGEYPTAPLDDSNHGGFSVTVAVHFYAPTAVTGSLSLSSDWGDSNSTQVSVPAGISVASIQVQASKVSLWWPNGLGQQPLYYFNISFTPSSGPVVMAARRVGFRVFALVTANDSNPAPLEGQDGSGNFTMRFKVNGANIYSRGGNMIPLEEYEGRANETAFWYLMQNVVAGHMNTLRIWGGGIFLYDVFYDAADELGILLYHDMMYAQGGHSPQNTTTQDAELRYQIRRLSHHPSIVVWDGCNECGGGGVYSSFVVTVISQEDRARVLWPSCPSYGWETGVDRLYGLMNGNPLVSRQGGNTIETHGPYQHGTGFKAVNGDPDISHGYFNPNTPTSLNGPANLGPYQQGVYASEFGCVAMSSFESMSVTLPESAWSLHAPQMYQRNYPCDNIILEYWGPLNLSTSFQSQLYQCIMGQAFEMKGDIEHRRSGNEFGTIIWQLGEIWPTGGWGSIEYASPVPGQVLGGRWKPLHYFLTNHLFADVFATCGTDANCFVKNDGIATFSGTVTFTAVNVLSGDTKTIQTWKESQSQAGPGAISWTCLVSGSGSGCSSYQTLLPSYGCDASGKDCVIAIQVADASGNQLSYSVMPLVPPVNMTMGKPQVAASATANSQGGADVVVKATGGVALWTVLTTTAWGRFSDNAFLVLPSAPVTVQFIPVGPFDLAALQASLRVEWAQLYSN